MSPAAPIQLASAQSCLPGDEMFLFRGSVGRVERLDGPPRFVDGRHLVESQMQGRLREVSQLRDTELEPLRVELRMRPTTMAREPRAVLVGWSEVKLLRHLVYLLPPSALAAARRYLPFTTISMPRAAASSPPSSSITTAPPK